MSKLKIVKARLLKGMYSPGTSTLSFEVPSSDAAYCQKFLMEPVSLEIESRQTDLFPDDHKSNDGDDK